MKKSAAIIIAVFSVMIFACNNKQEKATATSPTIKSKNTDSFNLAFDSVLAQYDSLKTAFINWDTVAINKSATVLEQQLLNVPYEQIKDDEQATKANSIAQNAAGAVHNISSQDSISNKRRIFYTASESIYNLAKAVDYDKAILYHKKCPMAFNGDQEGWWFSESKKIDNPYFGKFHPKYKNAMLTCGSVEDSVDNMQ